MVYSEITSNKSVTLDGKSHTDQYIGSYYTGLKNDKTGAITGNLSSVGTNITTEFNESNDWCTISFGTHDGTAMPILCTVTKHKVGVGGLSRSCKFKLKYGDKRSSIEFTIIQMPDNTSGDITPDPEPDGKFYIQVRGTYAGNVYLAESYTTDDSETKEYINAFGTKVECVLNDLYAIDLSATGGYITVYNIGGAASQKTEGDDVYVYVWKEWYYNCVGSVIIEYNTWATPVVV